MPDDIANWLEKLGLGKYADVFAENAINIDVLPHLSEEDLKELGLPLGHRRKLQAAIQTLADSNGPVAPSVMPDASPSSEAERRQLTVMFCDLVGSTALAERLDPEELRELLAQYQDTCAKVIQRYEGYIARYVGDGLLVYFGYPQAHEDDAPRGVRAGLDIVNAIQDLQTKVATAHVNLAVRIGIMTGLVVAGDIGSGKRVEEKAIVGETPNHAARLQAFAKPNTVVIGATTHHLVEGLFDCEDLGSQKLKGISQPVTAYRVRAESDAPSRFEAQAARGLTPLVGREGEISLLLKRWEQAKEGEGQVVLLSGEAGIGKSRIVRGFEALLQDETLKPVLYYGSPYHQNSAFFPAIDQLQRSLNYKKDDTSTQKLDKLDAILGDLSLPTGDYGPVLAHLLTVALDYRYPDSDLGPEQLRKKTLETIVSVIQAMAAQHPVLMVVEDMQWIDHSTQELITSLIEQLCSACFLLLITFRPEFKSPWCGYTHITSLTLNRLSRKESTAMVAKVTGGKTLPEEVLGQVVAKTDGVPLFVEELTKNILESGVLKDAGDRYVLSSPLHSLGIPTSLQDSLMARLDRLGWIKEVAQLAATVGRVFSRELLATVSPFDEQELEEALMKLMRAELIQRRGLSAELVYEFRHALLQDEAYQSLLKSTRQHYHQRIAHELEEQFPQSVEREPELIALHALRGEVWDKAVRYFRQAGSKALGRSAYREAVSCFEQALTALQHLPQNKETLEQALAIRFNLRTSLFPLGELDRVSGYLQEAETLSAKLDDRLRQAWVSTYMCHFRWLTGHSAKACDLGHRARAMAETLGHLPLTVTVNYYLGLACLSAGHYRRAEDFLRENIELLQGDLTRERFGVAGFPAAMSRTYMAWALAERGEFEEGLVNGQKGLQIAKELDHAWSFVTASWGLASLYISKGELKPALDLLERALPLSREWHLTALTPGVKGSLGYAYAMSGRISDGLSMLQEALEATEASKRFAFHSLLLVYLGEVLMLANQFENASPVAERALALAHERGERGVEAWALWLLGETFSHSDSPERNNAESYYQKAAMLANELGMRPLIARCQLGLGHTYRRAENPSKADEHLSEAASLFREMGMCSWLEETKQELTT